MSEGKKKGCLIITLVLIGVTILGIGGCLLVVGGVASEVSESIEADKKILESKPVSTIKWSELDQIYGLKSKKTDLQKDELWKKYQGEKVEWEGKVSSVGETLGSLQVQIKMKSTTMVSDVIVTLKEPEKSKAIEFSEGDEIRFQGVLNSWGTLMPISLKHGVIMND